MILNGLTLGFRRNNYWIKVFDDQFVEKSEENEQKKTIQTVNNDVSLKTVK